PLHMRLVYDEVFRRNRRPAIALPVVSRIHYDALRHHGCAVARVRPWRRAGDSRAIPDHRIVPSKGPIDRPRIRVEQQFGRVESITRGRIVASGHPIRITLTGTDAGK